jgi:hypothetical protein
VPIKGPPLALHSIHAVDLMSAPVSLSSLPLFSSQRPPWTARLTPFLSLCAGPRAPLELEAAPRATGRPPSPPLSSGAVDRASELCISVARLATSGCPQPCQAGAPWSMDDTCEHLLADRPIVSRLRPHHAARHRRALRVVWTSTWSVHLRHD